MWLVDVSAKLITENFLQIYFRFYKLVLYARCLIRLYLGRQSLVIVFTHKTISWINSQLIIYRMRLDFTHRLVLTNFVVSDGGMPCCKCAENYYIGL